jgi:hypothetical protein
MIESKDHPFPEFLKVKIDFSGACTIQLGIFYRGFSIYISFKHISKDARP